MLLDEAISKNIHIWFLQRNDASIAGAPFSIMPIAGFNELIENIINSTKTILTQTNEHVKKIK